MADFGFVGGAYESPSIYQDAQELINWYLEGDPTKSQGTIQMGIPADRGINALYPTPGTLLKTQLITAEVRGMKPLTGGNVMLAVCGANLYSINSSFVGTLIGTLNTSAGPVSIQDNAVDAYIVDGANRYYYNIASNTLTTLSPSDGAFVGGDKVEIVDNYFIYNNPNTSQWAATDPISHTTQALSFASKFGASDNLVTLMVVNREVFLLGENTTEAWTDVGGFPFPFSIIPGTNTQHGCAAKYSVSRIGESFAFVSQDLRGQGIIVHGEGYGFKRLSTHAVEQSLVGQVISDARAFTYQIEGHEFYVVTFPTADLTWVYDLAMDKWHKWLSVDSFNKFHRIRANCHCVFQGLNLVGDYQNGGIFALSNTTYTENGNPIRRLRRCPHLVQDFKRQFFAELQLAFQPGVGLTTGQGSDPQVMLRWSNDGGSTWSNEHWKSIGKMGRYKNRAIWRRLGMARDRIYEVSITDPVKAVIISANLIGDLGET